MRFGERIQEVDVLSFPEKTFIIYNVTCTVDMNDVTSADLKKKISTNFVHA